MMPREMTLMYV
jgi:hypothetical protein